MVNGQPGFYNQFKVISPIKELTFDNDEDELFDEGHVDEQA
jgi:hypothetical protein